MNADLVGRNPAQIVRQSPIPRARVRQVVELAAPTKPELVAALRRRALAGEIETSPGLSTIRLVTEGRLAGSYAVRVVLLPSPAAADPRWAVVCKNVGWALFGLAAVVGAVAWLLTAVSAAALATVCGALLAAFIAWVWMRHGRRGPREVVVQTTMWVR